MPFARKRRARHLVRQWRLGRAALHLRPRLGPPPPSPTVAPTRVPTVHSLPPSLAGRLLPHRGACPPPPPAARRPPPAARRPPPAARRPPPAARRPPPAAFRLPLAAFQPPRVRRAAYADSDGGRPNPILMAFGSIPIPVLGRAEARAALTRARRRRRGGRQAYGAALPARFQYLDDPARGGTFPPPPPLLLPLPVSLL